jgi:hypothetical protein
MEANAMHSVEAEAAEEYDTGDGVLGLCEACPREIVVNESLGRETAEEAPDDAMFKVEVNDVIRDDAGVLEDNGPDRRLATPLPDLLPSRPEGAQRIHGLRPRWVGAFVEDWEGELLGTTILGWQRAQPVSTDEIERRAEGLAEVLVVETDPRP